MAELPSSYVDKKNFVHLVEHVFPDKTDNYERRQIICEINRILSQSSKNNRSNTISEQTEE